MDCDAIIAEALAVRDCPSVRRLVLDAWCAPDRVLALRVVLEGVRAFVAHERALGGSGGLGGAARGPCERPSGVACWWLGSREMKTRRWPAMGWCEAGERLPKEAAYWAAEGQGCWFRLPNGG